MTKSGAGKWILTGDNTYTGTTTVDDGTLLVNGDNSAATGAVTVSSGGTLRGTGTIGGDVTVNSGGTLGPGAGIGDLTINADLTLAGDALFEIDGIGAGQFDRVLGIDAMTYGGTLTLNTSANFGPFTLDVADFTSQSGTFTSITDNGGNYAPGDLSFNYVTGEIVVVPEPSTFALTALGLLGLALFRRGSLDNTVNCLRCWSIPRCNMVRVSFVERLLGK